MDREKASQIARQVITAAITETDHAQLKAGDLVYWNCSTLCWKIIAIENDWATISDKTHKLRVPLTDLASDEAVRVNSYRAIYGDRCIMVRASR